MMPAQYLQQEDKQSYDCKVSYLQGKIIRIFHQ